MTKIHKKAFLIRLFEASEGFYTFEKVCETLVLRGHQYEYE